MLIAVAGASLADHGTAVALHDQQRPGEPVLPQGVLERGQVVPQPRPDLGAHDGGGVARELPDAGADLAGQRDEHLRVLLGDQLAQPPLVHRVAEGPQQRHRDRADPVVEQRPDRGAGLVLVQSDDDGAVPVDPLGDLQGVPLGEQAVVLGLPEDVLQLVRRAPEVAALDIHDEDRVAVALGGEEPDRRHVAHHQGVQRRRGAVGDVVGAGEHVRQGDAELLGQQLKHVEDPAGIVRRGGRGLRGEHGPGVVVQDGIGERAAHVHADDIGHGARSFTVEAAASGRGPGRNLCYGGYENVDYLTVLIKVNT